MNTLTARHGLSKIVLALAALALASFTLALAANSAKAANPGDPFAVDFNYAALTTGAAGNDIDSLVLKPSDNLGALEVRGQYKDAAGNFNLPKETGLTFPAISVAVGPVTVDGAIALLEDGDGNYNEATGALTMNTKISLTLGVDDIQALSAEIGFPIPGEGALTCAIGPLDLNLSTGGKWPHDAKPFGNKAALQDGSVAGYWDHKPDANSVGDPGKQYLCDLIGGLLDPVGGLWLANGTLDTYTEGTMPAASDPKPIPPVCEPPLEGTYPDCQEPVAVPKAKITKVKVSGAKIKKGKKGKITIKVTNKGNGVAKNVKVTLKSSNKQVKVPKSVKIKSIAAGKTATIKVTVKTTKKAKGKVTITAKAGGKTGKGKVTIRK
ncbi:MAG: hypothetical protein M9938_00130 [Solirubrobacterales bacterium]|nr:hypothetical protein [Solirubrobacterales bacterium]